jgi:hypothetical protein
MLASTDPSSHTGWKLLAMIAGPTVTVVLLAVAVWTAARWFSGGQRRASVVALIIGVGSLSTWWVAIPFARNWTGWVDIDHDGVLDGMTNGRYDSVDWYGGHWGALVLGSAVVGGIALAVLRRHVHSSSIEVPVRESGECGHTRWEDVKRSRTAGGIEPSPENRRL